MANLWKILALGSLVTGTLVGLGNYAYNSRLNQGKQVLDAYKDFLKTERVSDEEVFWTRAEKDMERNPEMKALVEDAIQRRLIDMHSITNLYADRAEELKKR